MVVDLEQKTYFLITGASRGIGKQLAIDLAAQLKTDSLIVLIARCRQGLEETKATILANASSTGRQLKVFTYLLDLGKAAASDFEDILRQSLDGVDVKSFERAFIVHNAGSLGDVSKRAIDVADTSVWTQFYHVNVFSVISLNCEFFRVFAALPKLVVNISSKCGIEPFSSMSFYCSSKAARDMYFRVLAAEEQEDHNTLVLNYAPGAIATDMAVQVEENSINTELAALFKQQREDKTMLTTQQTSEKLLKVLQEQKFTTGDHIDYWD